LKVFWSSKVFNFLLVILGAFNVFMWSFTKGEIEHFIFFLKFQRSFVLVFWSTKVFNFLLVILGVFKFFMWILKVFYFCILKLWNLQFSSCHFGGFTWGK
jgi:hypothetical protein